MVTAKEPISLIRLIIVFGHGINRPDDLSTSKWGDGVSRVMGFLPANFSFLHPSVLDLRSSTGQTDGQTDDGHQLIMPTP